MEVRQKCGKGAAEPRGELEGIRNYCTMECVVQSYETIEHTLLVSHVVFCAPDAPNYYSPFEEHRCLLSQEGAP